MKELKIKTTVENEIDIKDIDISKHLIVWKSDTNNYVLIKDEDVFVFKNIAANGGAVGRRDSINDIMNDTKAQAALKNGEIKIYEI